MELRSGVERFREIFRQVGAVRGAIEESYSQTMLSKTRRVKIEASTDPYIHSFVQGANSS